MLLCVLWVMYCMMVDGVCCLFSCVPVRLFCLCVCALCVLFLCVISFFLFNVFVCVVCDVRVSCCMLLFCVRVNVAVFFVV